MSGNYIGTNPNGTDYVLSDDYRTNNTKLFASTACVNNAVNEIKGVAYLPLGHFFLHPFPTPPDGCLVVNGSEYNRELYKDLFADAVRKNYVKPESEWQSIAAANGGYCPWYSDGDGSTTFRTPKFAPYQKLTLASGDAGKYYEAGLPNINGDFESQGTASGRSVNSNSLSSPLFKIKGIGTIDGGTSGAANYQTKVNFNASLVNSIYGNSNTVQPESNNWIVCVVAFGKATNVGSVDVANVIRVVDQVQAEVSNVMSVIDQVQADVATKLDNDTIRVIETWKSTDGTSWYRKYSDGWIEQGGPMSTNENVTFHVAFSDTNYYIDVTWNGGKSDVFWPADWRITKSSNTYFTTTATTNANNVRGLCWYACGY